MRHRVAIGVGALAVALFSLAGGAGAATLGYPPPTTGGTSCSTSETISVGGSSTVAVSCAFAPGAAITITVNGNFYGTGIAPASGTFVETFRVTDPHISLNDNTAVSTGYGATDAFVATGLNPAGDPNTATTFVTVPGLPVFTGSTGLAFTGADIIALVIGSFALIALGFLVLVFSRRRQPLPAG
jgi:hypothetical protein